MRIHPIRRPMLAILLPLLVIMPLIAIPIVADFSPSSGQGAVPPLPYNPWGMVTINGSPAPDGVAVTARIGGLQYTSTTTAGGWYTMDIPGDDADVPGKDGGATGDVVQFCVGDFLAPQAGQWSQGFSEQINLALSTASAPACASGPQNTPTYTPTPTPQPTPTATPGPLFSVDMETFPPVVAPGGRLPVTWAVHLGENVSSTYVMWDTITRAAHNDYRYHTASQSGLMGTYSDVIDVLADVQALYIKPYAVVDGVEVFGDEEYVVPVRLAINVGGDLWGSDWTGLYWNPDRPSDFSPTWYEIVGGERYAVNRPISNTHNAWIYRAQRRGISAFNCWLGSGVHEMTLEVAFHLAEQEASGPGQRVFDIVLEQGTPNEVALRNIDVFALAGGRDTALVLTTTVKVTTIPGSDEHLNITFASPIGHRPILNGLVLRGISAVKQYEIIRYILAGADDTYMDARGAHLGDRDIWLGGNLQYHGGLRFAALHMPQRAVIHGAWIEVFASARSDVNTELEIYAHAHDSSPDFSSQGIITNRPATQHFAAWHLLGTQWEVDGKYRSPELREVVQEIVDRPGWRDGNAVSLLLFAEAGTMSAPRKIWAYEGRYGHRARLTLYFTPREDIPTPASTPTATRTGTATTTATVTPAATQTATPTWEQERLFVPLVLKP